MNNEYGDITLDDKAFRVDITSFKTKDIVDFAPRATVPGNSAMMSDLSLYQPLVQTDFQHGMGFQWYTDSSGYMSTTGNMDTRHDGLAMMFTRPVPAMVNAAPFESLTTFEGKVYMWGSAGLYSYDGTTWDPIHTTSKVNYALNAGDYLIFCPDGGRIQKMTPAGVVSNAGLDASSVDYKWLIIHNGFIYAGVDGTNRIHFDSNSDLSQLEGTSADPDLISVGVGNIPTLGAVVYAGSLYVSRADGLWQIGEDKVSRRVLDYTDSISNDNFRSMSVLNGYLIFPIRDRVIQWNAYRTADITPSRITDEYPYTIYCKFKNFVAVDNFLLCTARTNEEIPTESILCFDGVGWHRLLDVIPRCTEVKDVTNMLAYEAINNRLWIHDQEDVSYIPMQSGSFPYPLFPLTGEHSLTTSRMDMGFRRITKSMNSMHVEARNVTETRYIRILYSLDGNDWTEWETITDNGITELRYPGGNGTVEFNYLLLKFVFVTDDETQTPVLEGYTINFIMRPDTKMGYTFRIIVASDSSTDLYTDGRSSAQILQDLTDIRNSKSPVRMTGLVGELIEGYLTSISGTVLSRTENDVEYTVQCSFVETFNYADSAEG